MDFLRTITTSHKGGIFCLKILDDSTYITGSNDKTLRVWNLNDHSLISTKTFSSDITCLGLL